MKKRQSLSAYLSLTFLSNALRGVVTNGNTPPWQLQHELPGMLIWATILSTLATTSKFQDRRNPKGPRQIAAANVAYNLCKRKFTPPMFSGVATRRATTDRATPNGWHGHPPPRSPANQFALICPHPRIRFRRGNSRKSELRRRERVFPSALTLMEE